MRKSYSVLVVVAIVSFMAFGIASAQQDSQNQTRDQKKSQMQESSKRSGKDADSNEFFRENLIALDRMTNQEININDENEMEVVNFLVDPMTGKIEYMIVSSEGWLGIGEERHVLPYSSLKVDPQQRMLRVSDAGITISDNTKYSPKRSGGWSMEEVAEYSEKTRQKNTIKESRTQEAERRKREMDQQKESKAQSEKRDYTDKDRQQALVEANRLYNRDIYGADGNQIGELDVILVDVEAGKIKMVVLEQNALFGLMGEKYLIPWQAMHFDNQSQQINLRVSEDNLNTYSKAKEIEDWGGSYLPRNTAVEMYRQYDYEYESR